MIKTYTKIKCDTKENRIFSVFRKYKLSEKEKTNISVSRTTLCTKKLEFFFGNCLFEYKIGFAVEKT